MTETTTRNARLAERAALAHEFVQLYAGLPDIGKIDLDEPWNVNESAEIELQLRSLPDTEVQAIATWARELGTPVRFRDHSNYVEVSAWTLVHGHSVKVWDHISTRAGYRMLARLGVDVDGTVDIDPARLLELLSTADAKAGVS